MAQIFREAESFPEDDRGSYTSPLCNFYLISREGVCKKINDPHAVTITGQA